MISRRKQAPMGNAENPMHNSENSSSYSNVSKPRTARKNNSDDSKVVVPHNILQIRNQQKCSLIGRPGCRGKETPEEVPAVGIESPPPTMSVLLKPISTSTRRKQAPMGNAKNPSTFPEIVTMSQM
jgi:hypothetical protein